MTEAVQKVERPKLQGRDYRPHYPARMAYAYMDQQDREIADLKSKLEAAEAKAKDSERARRHTQDWYARHYGKLEDWARKVLPEPHRTQFFNCVANGSYDHTLDVGEPYICKAGFAIVPTNYFRMDTAEAQLLRDQTSRAEDAEGKLADAEADAEYQKEVEMELRRKIALVVERMVVSDSLGVEGSDFLQCLMCGSGSQPGSYSFEHKPGCLMDAEHLESECDRVWESEPALNEVIEELKHLVQKGYSVAAATEAPSPECVAEAWEWLEEVDKWYEDHPEHKVKQEGDMGSNAEYGMSKLRAEVVELQSKLADAEARIARMKEAGEDLVQAGNRLMENTRWDNATINWNRAIHGGPEVKL